MGQGWNEQPRAELPHLSLHLIEQLPLHVLRSALHCARPFFVVVRLRQALYITEQRLLHCARTLFDSTAGATASSSKTATMTLIITIPHCVLSVSATNFSTAIV